MTMNTYSQKSSYTSSGEAILPLYRKFPSLCFYPYLLGVLLKSAHMADRGCYSGHEWGQSSARVMDALERVGCHMHVEGMEHFQGLEEPCVFVGNHMSSLETFVLPCLIQPWKSVTFVVKSSLMKYPVFHKVLGSRDPIVVDRVNPREDFVKVMEGGVARLKAGRSIIIFPQSTRTETFDVAKFNSIGVKLAKKAGALLVPFALQTNALSNGKLLRDFGPIRPERPIFFRFGAPLSVQDSGKEEHKHICDFIEQSQKDFAAKAMG